MTSHDASLPLTVTAMWDRTLVPAGGGDAALLIRITPAPATSATPRRAPVDVAFVLDRSGSMAGEKLTLAKEAVSVAISHLREDDRAALVMYDHAIETLQELAPATTRLKTLLRLSLQGIDSGGSTNLAGGWLTGCEHLARGMNGQQETRIRRALLLTDGLANVGITNPSELTHHAHELRQRGITTTTLGVGLDFDEDLLASMAEAGGGNFQFIAHPRELPDFFQRELGELLTVVATNLSLSLTLPSGVHARLISAFPNERQGKRISVSLRDLSAVDEICLVFTVTTKPVAAGTHLHATLHVQWTDPAVDARQEIERELPPLMAAAAETVAATPVNEEVAEEAALQRAAAAQREAMRLDREGRYAEAQEHLRASLLSLSAAPQSARVAGVLERYSRLAEMDASQGYGEDVRKRVTFETMRRLRRKDDSRG